VLKLIALSCKRLARRFLGRRWRDSMSESAGSITRLIPQLRQRDDLAIHTLWERYMQRIHNAARPVVARLAPGAGDEEDVAQSAFQSFCEAAATGRLPDLGSRNELWRLLFAFTRRKAIDRVRRETRHRRGGGAAVVNNAPAVDRACDSGIGPVEIVELQESLNELFRKLMKSDDGRLTEIALLRLEGATNAEIAARFGCAVRTIQRKLHLLERLWTEQS
jgi:DNA-directed RNA polymerase specialized sigma24 family protein